MNASEFHFGEQIHGYRSGHQLLSATLRVGRNDQDVLDRLSDMAGQLRPGETFLPYITGYPLPSGEYFVFAKTWQDLFAPRSGCVRSQSLLIPMQEWSAITDVSVLLHLFRNPELSEDDTNRPRISPEDPITDPRRYELVEALFLEERQPIVMFDCDEAQSIALRVVSSLLSGLRPDFAFGTFTLAPRMIGGRPFDLLFAPSGTRLRFATWPGRRIEKPKNTGEKSRHRWTADLVNRIFGGNSTRLEIDEALGFAPELDRIDENALRLSLRWKELVNSAASSPTAALGLLDILNSRDRLPLDGTVRLFPVLNNAVTRAVTHLPPDEAWTFIAALLSKFPKGRLPSPLRKHLYWAVSTLAVSAPQATLRYLSRTTSAQRELPLLLENWVGDGLSKTENSKWLWDIPEQTLGRLLTASRSLARRVVDELHAEPSSHQMATLLDIAHQASVPSRRRLLRSIASRLDQSEWAPLLAALLRGLTEEDVARAAVDIGQATGFRIPEMDSAFAAATDDHPGQLRRAILKFDSYAATDRFLLSTLYLTSNDIDWVALESCIDEVRKSHLLSKMVGDASAQQVRDLILDQDRLRTVLHLLDRDPKGSASAVARLLESKTVTAQLELTIGLNALPYLEKIRQSNLAELLLVFAVADPNTPAKIVAASARGFVAAGHPVETLLQKCFATYGNDRLIGRNLVALSDDDLKLKQDLVKQVSLLSSYLIRRFANFGEDAYLAWAGLLSDGMNRKQENSDELALMVISYALRLTSFPASSLVVATFPRAYQALKSATGKSSLFSMNKAKWLSNDLVDSFMRSSWPPKDLASCAVLCGDPKAIFKRVGEMWRGDDYLQRLKLEASLLPADLQKKAFRALSVNANGS